MTTWSWQWAGFAAAIAIISLGCGPAEQELKTSEWVTSDDGALSFRLLAYDPVSRRAPITLLGELRNNTEDELRVLLPFGYEPQAMELVKMHMDGQQIFYSGPASDYSLGTNCLTSIAPGQTVRDSIELPVDVFPGSDRSGDYAISYPYATAEFVPAVDMVSQRENSRGWRIESEPITVTRSLSP